MNYPEKRKKLCFWSLALSLISFNLFCQDVKLHWAKQFGGLNTQYAYSTVIGKSGNIYVAGPYSGTTDFDPGPGVFNLTGGSGLTLYVCKLNSAGNFIWAKSFDGTSCNSVSPIAIDSLENIYTIEYGGATSDLDPGPGVYTPSAAGSFISKLDSAGNFVWAKTFNQGVGGIEMNNIAIGRGDFVYVTGALQGTIDLDPGTGIYNLTSAGGRDIFVLKLSAAGNYIWAKMMGGTAEDVAKSISVDMNGNVYTTGYFYGTSDFNPGTMNNSLVTTSTTDMDVFISKLDTAGNYIWAKDIGGSGNEYAYSSVVDSFGNIYYTGTYNGTVDFDPNTGVFNLSGSTYFTSKLSSTGVFVWAKSMGGSATDIALDNNNVYTTGTFTGTADFDPGTGTYNLVSFGSNDFHVTKLDGAGNFKWAKEMGGAGSEKAQSVCLDNSGNVYLAGWFDATTDFDPDAGIYNLSSVGGIDAFILKLTNCVHDAPDICLVTADSLALNNVIYWDKSLYPLADSFVVYRYDAFSVTYLQIGAVAMSDTNNFLIDTARNVGGPNGGDPQYSSNRYKLAIRGVCGDLGTMGLYHESIFIQENLQNFNWNAYGIEGQSSPVTGYQFARDNINTGSWQVLVNTGGLSTTDPNYLSYPNGNWRVDALGFSCSLSMRLGSNSTEGSIVKSRSNVKTNRVNGINTFGLSAVKVYPNPATNEITIQLNKDCNNCSVEITNALGQTIKSEKLSSPDNRVNISSFSNGVYYLKVKSNTNAQLIQKIVVQH